MAPIITVRRQRHLIDTRPVTQGSSDDVSEIEHSVLAPKVLSLSAPAADALTAATITTTETAFATQVAFAANALLKGTLLRVTAVLDEVTSGTPVTQLFTLRLQATGPTNTNLAATSAVTPTASLSHRGATLSWLLQVTGTPGSAANVETAIEGGAVPGAAQSNLSNTVAQGVAVDTTQAQTLQLTLTYSGNTAGNTVTLRQLLVEQLV